MTSFRDVYVDFEGLKKVVHQSVLQGEVGYLTLTQTTEKYSLALSTLECLLKNNAIPYKKKSFGGRQYALMREADVLTFLETYIKATDVAKRFHKHRSKISSLLASKGVLPLWRPQPGDSCRWYARDEVKNLNL